MKNSNRKIAVALIIAFAFVLLSGCFHRKNVSAPAALTMYGLDESDVIEPLIAKYRETHPNITVKYKKFSDPAEFEDLIVNEIAEGEGPDIFYIDNTWLPRHIKKIVPLQSESLIPAKFKEVFVNVAAEDFIQPSPQNGSDYIYALPLYVDTLALYYNKRDFEQKIPERGKPDTTWDGFESDASRFRTEDSGQLTHGAIALGRSDNMRLAPEAVYNFWLQAGFDLFDGQFKQMQFAGSGKETFEYFLSYARKSAKNYSWDASLTPEAGSLKEVEAFLSGKVSAILAYSDLYRALENNIKNIKTRSSVIDLKDIGVAPVPQISLHEGDLRVLAHYYGLAVSRNSRYQAQAWDFAQTLASQSSGRFYHEKTGRPAARRDLIEEQRKEPVTEVFVSQLGFAGSLRIFSKQRMDKIISGAIIDVNAGVSAGSALSAAQEKINAILKIEAPDGLYPKPKPPPKK